MDENKQELDLEIRVEQRTQRADDYNKRTGKQQEWYSGKATANKKGFRGIGVSIVILGALVSVIPILMSVVFDQQNTPSPSDLLVSFFGALIVILKGIERIWLPEEAWQNYRKASEALKRERECYIEGVAQYEGDLTEEDAYRLYVNRCIRIKAEEQNNFWGMNESKTQEKSEEPPEDTPSS
ncbi:MAG: DUF4231 domain-containing protein [Chromatiales bacterium]|jgi:hypothetical protein